MAIHSLTRSELHDLLQTARRSSERDWLIILVSYWHGLRISEILGLTPGWVQDGYLTVRRLKGSLKTVQPLVKSSDPLLDESAALPSYLANLPVDARAFPITRQYFWKVFRRYAEQAGVPAHKRHPHVLKHSIALHSIETAGIQNVRQHLGHRSMSSTGEYLKVSDDQATAAVTAAVVDGVKRQPVIGIDRAAKVDGTDRYSSAAKKAWDTRRRKALEH